MNILFWDPLNGRFLGGAEIVIARLRREFEKLGIESHIASCIGEDPFIQLPRRELSSIYPTHNLNIFSPFLGSLEKKIEVLQPDVIYVMSTIMMDALLRAVYTYRKRKGSRKPIIIMDMGVLETDLSGIRKTLFLPQYMYYLAIHKYYYSLLDKFDYINTCSLNNKRILEKQLSIRSEKMFTINTNIVPDDWFCSTNISTRNDSMIFSPGRVELFKGYPTLLKTIKRLVSDFGHSDLKIYVLNNGRFISDLKQFIFDEGIAKNFEIMEKVSSARVKDLYLQSSIVPVMYMHANVYSQVICEGMATGNIVVASNIGAFKEIIHEGKNGYLVGLEEPFEAAKKMHDILTNDELRRELRLEAISTAYDKCLASKQARCLLGKLVELCESSISLVHQI